MIDFDEYIENLGLSLFCSSFSLRNNVYNKYALFIIYRRMYITSCLIKEDKTC